MNPKFVTLVLIGLSLINTNTFTMDSQLRRPLLGPELSGGQEMVVPGALAIPDLELGGVTPTGVQPQAHLGWFGVKSAARCVGACLSAVKQRLDATSFDTKRAMEVGVDVTLFDGSMYGYSQISRNKFFPLLFSQAVGQAAAEATESYRYSMRILVSGLVYTACRLGKSFAKIDIATLSTSALLCMVYTSLDKFAELTGQKNKFPDVVKRLPAPVLEFIVERLRTLAQLIAAIKEGRITTAEVIEVLMQDLEKLGTNRSEFMAACAKVVDIEAQDIVTQKEGACCSTTKNLVKKVVDNYWQPLPEWLKTTAKLAVLGGINVSASAAAPILVKTGIIDDGMEFFVAHATGRAAAGLTEQYDCEYKVLGGGLLYGGCRALSAAAGLNTYTVATGAIIYLIYSMFNDYADFIGIKDSFEQFKNLPPAFDELLKVYLSKVRLHVEKKLAHADVEVMYGPELV